MPPASVVRSRARSDSEGNCCTQGGVSLLLVPSWFWIQKNMRSFGCRGTISAACNPMALIIVETILHRLSKSPCVPFQRPFHNVMRYKMRGPDLGSLEVRNLALSDLNFHNDKTSLVPHL